ncbi:TIGR03862 family flavoprotein [Aestuariispira insulae]|uniref:NAD(FAD)-utilizing dehydrogenase n=1 Tax=Aestuariispira insulae TaxID=1461337 RepID=A0A3D9HMM7_9PROT|nr:TIGR03862 family flavoprotein [Aestuariispira insulae]RED50743.1 hypothetical protein DFP90_10414 [Aestuariispira insulae]
MTEQGNPVVSIIGGGPAGLMAAEALTDYPCEIHVYDAMPSFGRKFLMAGKSGLNLTHAEAYESFLKRYGARQEKLKGSIDRFPPKLLQEWAAGLGIETFVGSSGRIFPTHYKASPLLRAWLERLDRNGVQFHRRHRWVGWSDHNTLCFETDGSRQEYPTSATILAMGGGSWSKLGSDAAWIPVLERSGIAIQPLRPSNCGFGVDWSDHFRGKFSGEPVKTVCLSTKDTRLQGEFVISHRGIEGSAVYALSARLRDQIAQDGKADLYLDLLPDIDEQEIFRRLERPRGADSKANHLRKTLRLKGVKAGLLRELTDKQTFEDNHLLAQAVKALPIPLTQPHPIDEAISTAGGVCFQELNDNLMIRKRPSVFCAGEMLDWEAPTGGYLLNACLATGLTAGLGAANWLHLDFKPH